MQDIEITNVISTRTKLFKSLNQSTYKREEMNSSPLALIAKQCWHHNLVLMVSEEHWVCSGCLFFVHLSFFLSTKSIIGIYTLLENKNMSKTSKWGFPLHLKLNHQPFWVSKVAGNREPVPRHVGRWAINAHGTVLV